MNLRPGRALVLAALSGLTAMGCTAVGPEYRRPDAAVPAAYKETGPWKAAAPRDQLPKGAWWQVFGDPLLDGLEERAQQGSPRLQAAAARVDQARALAGVVDANAWPTLEFAPDAARYRASGNRPDQPSKVPGNVPYTTDRFRLPLYASYEVDLWGKLRRQREAADARVEASQAAYATVMLALQAELAQTYFAQRAAQEDLRILVYNLDLRRKALDLVVARVRNGLATEFDLARVETEVATTEGELEAAARRSVELQNALAVLVGQAPETFTLTEQPLSAVAVPPTIPVGLPSDLLERRPDVAEAERLMMARNAEIGVAEAAFFPSIKLTGGAGFESAELSDLLKGDSAVWALAASLTQPLFEGGRIRANVDRAQAAWRENVAVYRERVLVAFREVDDALASLRYLSGQNEAQTRAVASAEKAERLATARYRSGLTVVLDVIDAQRVRLLTERARLQTSAQRMLVCVALVRALGGGWSGTHSEAGAPATSVAPVPQPKERSG